MSYFAMINKHISKCIFLTERWIMLKYECALDERGNTKCEKIYFRLIKCDVVTED